MPENNAYGLSRYIPADVQRAVRQECGFGCVRCGKAFYQYHHFEPEFKDAKCHDPAGIALLCGGCHEEATRGKLSVLTVKYYRTKPIALQKGWCWDSLDLLTKKPIIRVGFELECCFGPLVTIGDEVLLRLDYPEAHGGPCRLSGIFTNPDGSALLEIKENCVMPTTSYWDITNIGPRLEIRSTAKDVVFRLESKPPHEVNINRLNVRTTTASFMVNGNNFVCNHFPTNGIFMGGIVKLTNSQRGIVLFKDGKTFG